MARNRGYVHLYTGEGEGKTITAFGLALRALGHGQRVIVVQFMKGRKNVGEYKIKKKLGKNYEVRQFGRKEFIELKNPSKRDYELAKKGLKFAREALKRKPNLLILDEINLATATGLLKLEDVIDLLKQVPENTVIVLTGRRAPKELIEISDLATEMKEIKHPMQRGVPARRGVEY